MSTSLRSQTGVALAALVVLASACGTTTSSAPAVGAPQAAPVEAAIEVENALSNAPAPESPSPVEPVAPVDPVDPANPPTEAPAPADPPADPSDAPSPTPATPDPDPVDPADPGPEPSDDPDTPDPVPLPDVGDVLVAVEAGDSTLEVTELGTFELGVGQAQPECGLVSTAPAHPDTSTAWTIDAFGDGTADDVVNVFYNGAWRLRLYPSGGGTSEVVLADPGDAHAAVFGDVRLEGSDGDAILAKLHTAGDHTKLGLFGVDDNRCVFQYTYASGYGVVLSVRETADLHEGVWCAASVGQYRAERQGDGSWDWFMTSLARSGATTLDWTPGWGGNASTSELNPVGFDCLGYEL